MTATGTKTTATVFALGIKKTQGTFTRGPGQLAQRKGHARHKSFVYAPICLGSQSFEQRPGGGGFIRLAVACCHREAERLTLSARRSLLARTDREPDDLYP